MPLIVQTTPPFSQLQLKIAIDHDFFLKPKIALALYYKKILIALYLKHYLLEYKK